MDDLRSMCDELNKITESIPEGDLHLFSLISPKYKAKAEEINSKIHEILSDMLSTIFKYPLPKIPTELENYVDESICSFLNSSDCKVIQKQEVTKNGQQFIKEKEIDGYIVICQNHIQNSIFSERSFDLPKRFDTIKEITEDLIIRSYYADKFSLKIVITPALIQNFLVQKKSKFPKGLYFLSFQAHSIYTYNPFICSLTIMSQDMDSITVDFIHFKGNLTVLHEFLLSSEIKVIYNAQKFLPILRQSIGMGISNVISLAEVFGETQAKVLELNDIYLKPSIVDWRIRPLTDSMKLIIQNDTVYLPILLNTAIKEHTQKLFEEAQKYSLPIELPNDFEEGFSFVKNSLMPKWNTNTEKATKDLLNLRDYIGRELDIAPRVFLGNRQIVSIVRANPKTEDELLHAVEPPLCHLARSYTLDILAALEEESAAERITKIIKNE